MSENPQGSAPGNPPGDPGAGTPPPPAPSFEAPPPAPSYDPPPAPPAPPAYGNPPAAPPSYGTPPSAPPTGAVAYGSQPPGAPSYATPPGGVSPSDEKMWAIFAHVGPFLIGFLAPLIIYLVYKDRSDFIRDQSAEALNWQITLTIASVVGFVLIVVLIGILILVAVGILGLVLGIMAAVAANRGERYRYPWALRLVK